MAKIRVADFITDYLYTRYNVKHIFMLSGGGSIYLDDSVATHPHVEDICIRNEATAPMMANGYVKSGGKLGVAYVTTGPGSANAAAGLVESWVDSCPILVISGQVNSDQTIQSKRKSGVPDLRSCGTQELDILKMVEPITKKCLRLENKNDVKKYLDDLITVAQTDRKGPVWLEIPLDIQAAYLDIDAEAFGDISLVVERLKKSKKPLVLVGQGIRGCEKPFKQFIDTLGIPFIVSRMALDVFPYAYKYNLGTGGIKGRLYNNELMKEADLIIAVGTTLSPAFVGKDTEFLGDNIIYVDVDSAELNKFNHLNKDILKIQMSSSDFFRKLLNNLGKFEYPFEKWRKKAFKIKEKNEIVLKKTNPIDIYDLVKTIDKLSIENDIFVSDAGSSYYVTQQTLEFNKKGQKDLTSGAYASMGVSIPLAIGAALKNPSDTVIVITGDGSIETNIQELKTVSYYDLNIKIFVINNGGYISMRDHQDKLFDGRYINATEETGNPALNFEDVAKTFGLDYVKIDTFEFMNVTIKTILQIKGPVLAEVICDSKQKLINPLTPVKDHKWVV